MKGVEEESPVSKTETELHRNGACTTMPGTTLCDAVEAAAPMPNTPAALLPQQEIIPGVGSRSAEAGMAATTPPPTDAPEITGTGPGEGHTPQSGIAHVVVAPTSIV